MNMGGCVADFLIAVFLGCVVVDLMFISSRVLKIYCFIEEHAKSTKKLVDWVTRSEKKGEKNDSREGNDRPAS